MENNDEEEDNIKGGGEKNRRKLQNKLSPSFHNLCVFFPCSLLTPFLLYLFYCYFIIDLSFIIIIYHEY